MSACPFIRSSIFCRWSTRCCSIVEEVRALTSSPPSPTRLRHWLSSWCPPTGFSVCRSRSIRFLLASGSYFTRYTPLRRETLILDMVSLYVFATRRSEVFWVATLSTETVTVHSISDSVVHLQPSPDWNGLVTNSTCGHTTQEITDNHTHRMTQVVHHWTLPRHVARTPGVVRCGDLCQSAQDPTWLLWVELSTTGGNFESSWVQRGA